MFFVGAIHELPLPGTIWPMPFFMLQPSHCHVLRGDVFTQIQRGKLFPEPVGLFNGILPELAATLTCVPSANLYSLYNFHANVYRSRK
jgi:hypothetical protein